MLIADILRQYSFGCTLRYALFTGEEQGLVGSDAYAADVFAAGEDLEAVLNLDMLGYNTPSSSPKIELHTRPSNGNDLAIANLFDDVVDAYGLDLVPQILQDGESFSDHASFWERGYPAILAIEDWDDHTPYYHTTNDQLESLNMGYYTEFVKASLATFAHMGCLQEGELRGTVRNAATSTPISGATVQATLNSQTSFSATTQPDGTYQMSVLAGNYTVSFSAPDYLTYAQGASVVAGQTTTLNASLQPCITVKQVDFTFSPQWPLVDQTVTFTGTVGIGDPPISYAWEFGDGSSGSGPVVTHAYAGRGGFPAKLTVNNACGVPAIVYHPVFVEAEIIFLPLVGKN
jgi:hypothetical protein